MELISIKDKNKLFKDMFYDLLNSYQIIINKDYQFIYDEFFDHIIFDTNVLTEKNFKSDRKGDKIKYKMVIFKSVLYRHLVSSTGEMLRKPEKFPELRKIVRLKKLNKIEKYGSM